VYEQATGEIVVRAAPAFHEGESNPARGHFVWIYSIEIENRGRAPVQLIARHWRITDGNGLTHDVRGEGVVGKQPVIEPGEVFSYTSVCPLATPAGWMQGEYAMIDADTGAPFEIEIPAFALESPHGPPPS